MTPLLATNPYLTDPAERAQLLAAAVLTSTRIEMLILRADAL